MDKVPFQRCPLLIADLHCVSSSVVAFVTNRSELCVGLDIQDCSEAGKGKHFHLLTDLRRYLWWVGSRKKAVQSKTEAGENVN